MQAENLQLSGVLEFWNSGEPKFVELYLKRTISWVQYWILVGLDAKWIMSGLGSFLTISWTMNDGRGGLKQKVDVKLCKIAKKKMFLNSLTWDRCLETQ